jgi:hypothetical protein
MSLLSNTVVRDNSITDALRRVRAGGAVVPAKCRNAKHTCSITPSFGRPHPAPVRTQHRSFHRVYNAYGK